MLAVYGEWLQSVGMEKTNIQYFASNRDRKTVTILSGFTCWEHVQACFRMGFIMPDGHMANGIGRNPDVAKAAAKSGYTILA